ncbi:hypothetical protein [Prevotella sp. KH2C16]|uniref:hypothetical protein n=1 Tax=Prevotella sp. KH2C16 TaxID=1855325 RepID=UPI0008EF77AD|nr:hypothetical protein [Prevotella sp. KH2C16]SFG38119.1 hypothetical protein SAMN05216383_1128 [Prevotella sp. KH2C16]SFG75583.1 hypothetical protein SAMN05216383_13914 [Prevotella sp. KH2C16]
MDRIKTLWRLVAARWRAKTPKFFGNIIKAGTGIATVAVAIQGTLAASGASVPGWWETAFPYLVGIPAGMAAVAKLTREDNKNEDKN